MKSLHNFIKLPSYQALEEINFQIKLVLLKIFNFLRVGTLIEFIQDDYLDAYQIFINVIREVEAKLNMPSKLELSLMLFYSNLNKESLNTRIAINEFVENHHQSFEIKATVVNYDREKNICRQHGVTGIPTLLVFLNKDIVGRYYGEITIKEIEAIVQNNVSI